MWVNTANNLWMPRCQASPDSEYALGPMFEVARVLGVPTDLKNDEAEVLVEYHDFDWSVPFASSSPSCTMELQASHILWQWTSNLTWQ